MMDKKIENGEEIVLGLRKDYTVINNSEGPDEMFSYSAMILNYTIRTILVYEETLDLKPEEKMTVGKLIDEVTKIVHTYGLVDAGMSAEEAAEITNIEGTIHEIRKKNTKE